MQADLAISMGFNQLRWLSDTELDAEFASLAKLGVTLVRTDLLWTLVQKIEPTAVGQATYDWSAFDRVVRAAQAYGIDLLPILGNAPGWATPAGNIAEFAAFAAAAVERYAPRGITAWEIWNEPNLASFWEGAPDPRAYAALLTAAYDAIKAVDSNAIVILGGLSPVPSTDTSSEMKYYSATEFLKEVYKAGRDSDFFDAIGFHPYSTPLMPGDTASWNGWKIMTNGIRSVMEANGDTEKQIWITEYGGPTSGGGSAISEQKQAIMLMEAAGLASQYSWIGSLMWYSFRDIGVDPNDKESWFGLIDPSGNPKTAYDFFRDVIQFGPTVVAGSTVESSVSRDLTSSEGKLALIGTSAANGTGNNAANILVGNSSENVLTGRDGADIIHGGAGDDRLIGDNGSDRLYGGSGADALFGGSGADILFGGSGADSFIFASAAHSPAAAHDVIYDFSRSEGDRIDLSGIDANAKKRGDQAFNFIGENGFSGRAGELSYGVTESGVVVRGDVDGDRSADLSMELRGVSALDRWDFIL